jgi:flavodoxin
MKTIILYYSFTGKTKELAVKKANETGADIEEIIELKKPSVLKAFFVGVLKARKRKTVDIQPIKSDLSKYELIVILCPVWASNPAPAFNNIVEHLPSGKKVELIMNSAGGGTKSSADGTKALIVACGCIVTEYTDVKAKGKS